MIQKDLAIINEYKLTWNSVIDKRFTIYWWLVWKINAQSRNLLTDTVADSARAIWGKCKLWYILNMSKHIHKSILDTRNLGSHILIWSNSSSSCSSCCCRGIPNKRSDGSKLVCSCTSVSCASYSNLQSSKLVCWGKPSRCIQENNNLEVSGKTD